MRKNIIILLVTIIFFVVFGGTLLKNYYNFTFNTSSNENDYNRQVTNCSYKNDTFSINYDINDSFLEKQEIKVNTTFKYLKAEDAILYTAPLILNVYITDTDNNVVSSIHTTSEKVQYSLCKDYEIQQEYCLAGLEAGTYYVYAFTDIMELDGDFPLGYRYEDVIGTKFADVDHSSNLYQKLKSIIFIGPKEIIIHERQ